MDEITIIIWSTDHGDALACQRGHFDKDSHMAQEVMRIPLIMNWKGRIHLGIKNHDLVFTCDIPATIMDAAGAEFGNKSDGKNLIPLATGEKETEWRDRLMCETYGHGYGIMIIARMLVKRDYKYVCNQNEIDELYNLKDDPYEKKILAQLPEYREKVLEMRASLKEEQKKAEDPIDIDCL